MKNQTELKPRFYNVGKAAEILGLSVWTVRTWAYTGKIASAKLGSRLMVPAEELEKIAAEAVRPRLAK
ncbi:MAG: helix-turn-helix domain-containing protein [Acidobacteriaceae bacterium]